MKIEARGIRKSFGNPPQEVLHGIDFIIESGEFVALTGKSGSGKSTLLYTLSTLDKPTEGKVLYDGEDTSTWDVKTTHRFRNLKTGFVFQFHYLLPELTVIENILLPAMKTRTEDRHRDRQQRVGKGRADHQQKPEIARNGRPVERVRQAEIAICLDLMTDAGLGGQFDNAGFAAGEMFVNDVAHG